MDLEGMILSGLGFVFGFVFVFWLVGFFGGWRLLDFFFFSYVFSICLFVYLEAGISCSLVVPELSM